MSISPKQLEALGWRRTNPGAPFAQYEHVDGWKLLHCHHPTALYPYSLFNPAGQLIAAPNGRNFQNVARAVEWLAEKWPDTIPPPKPRPAPLPLFDTPKHVQIGDHVLQGSEQIAVARSKTMAKRIANALNNYAPNSEGV